MLLENIVIIVTHEELVTNIYISVFDNRQKRVTSIIVSMIRLRHRPLRYIVSTPSPSSW